MSRTELHISSGSASTLLKREGDVVLRDGSTVHVRPIRQLDEEGLLTLFRSMSDQSRWLRFFSPAKDGFLITEARREANADGRAVFALVATTGPGERIVADAFYSVLSGGRAEVAFAIADDYQGRGLGTILLAQLAEVAAAHGINVFEADVMSANHRMLNVFRESGFPIEVSAAAGQLHVNFPTSLTPHAIERFENREKIAAANAVTLFFNPRSVAVVGASRQRGTISGEIFHNLLTYGFQGPVYPVNSAAEVVQCVPAYPTVEAIPGPVDLAIIAVPAERALEAAEQCGRKGVRALLVITAGFAETGEEGRRRQEALMRICRSTGMRLIGPNCMGVMNTDPGIRLNATFAPSVTPPGKVGFSSQSGALGLAIIEYANSLGLGISSFVSIGNKADISGNDLLQYWESDPRTEAILLYLESFGNPKKFSRIARRIGRTKPIAVVKSGRSRAGVRATSSHTGAMMAASDVTVDALFRQCGVIRTDTLEELFDVASLVVNQPLPKGPRVGIVTNAGGPAILCADACEARDLEVPVFSQETQTRLRAALRPEASVSNPVDMIASATADHYRQAIETVAQDPNIDAVIAIFTPPLVTRAQDVAKAIVDSATAIGGSKPVIAVLLSTQEQPEEFKTGNVRVPCYAFPEAAAIALARAARYGKWREQPLSEPPDFDDIKRDEATAIIAAALERGGEWLTPEETASLLRCYGLPLVDQTTAANAEEAGKAASEMRRPVALKAIAAGLLHKTEMGAVRLNIEGGDEVRRAAEEMAHSLAEKGFSADGFLIQPMIEKGVEMIVGIVHDPQFGPVIACGAGGVMVELLHDVSVRLTPLTREDASEMIRNLKTYPLLTGFRGSAPADVSALEDGLLRVSRMVEDLPEIMEMDCNPFVVHEQGAAIIDARIRIVASEPAG